MQSWENNTAAPAGFFVRLAAFFLDMLLIGFVLLLLVRLPMLPLSLSAPDNWFMRDILFQFSLYDMLLYVAAAAYFIVMTYTSGQTMGKRLMNLQVVSTNGEPLTLFNVIYRETIGRYLSSLLFLGYLMIGVTQEKRGLHDILADTGVVYACKVPTVGPQQTVPAYGQAQTAPAVPPVYRTFASTTPVEAAAPLQQPEAAPVRPAEPTTTQWSEPTPVIRPEPAPPASPLQTPPPITYRPFGGADTTPKDDEIQ